MITVPRCWTLLLLLSLGSRLILAEEAERPSEAQRAEHLARMKDLAASIRLLDDPQREDSAVKLVASPLLRYADDTRQTYESSLWLWSGGGRPSAVLAVEFYPQGLPSRRWLYEIASLSVDRIAAERGKEIRWTAEKPGLAFAPLDATEPVADKPGRRLTQMKKLRERFSAHEPVTLGGRIELRPLAAPLHRYASAEQDIIDGAIFAFCNGTNPEVLLVLEAQKTKAGPPAWHYALVKLTGEMASAELDDKLVWERALDEPPAVRENYINGYLPGE